MTKNELEKAVSAKLEEAMNLIAIHGEKAGFEHGAIRQAEIDLGEVLESISCNYLASEGEESEPEVKKITLELVGLDGNAYALMGAFRKQARRENWTDAEISSVLDECKTGNYDHLLQTLIAHCDHPDDENTCEDSDCEGCRDCS